MEDNLGLRPIDYLLEVRRTLQPRSLVTRAKHVIIELVHIRHNIVNRLNTCRAKTVSPRLIGRR